VVVPAHWVTIFGQVVTLTGHSVVLTGQVVTVVAHWVREFAGHWVVTTGH
jgi:hypothetical protein